MQNKPFFSIVIPVYQTNDFLSECLNSIINQTFEDYECIVILDGLDTTASKIFQNLVGKDSRFSLIVQKHSGVSDARNTGMLKSCGEFLIFLDSDDLIKKDGLISINNKLLENKEFWKNSIFIGCKTPPVLERPNSIDKNNFLVYGDVGITEGPIHSSIIKQTKFKHQLNYAEDLEIIFQIITKVIHKKDIRFINLKLNNIEYRVRPESLSNKLTIKEKNRKKIELYQSFIESKSISFKQKLICQLAILNLFLRNSSNPIAFFVIRLNKFIGGWN